jgi:ATP-dependent helicase HrpB
LVRAVAFSCARRSSLVDRQVSVRCTGVGWLAAAPAGGFVVCGGFWEGGLPGRSGVLVGCVRVDGLPVREVLGDVVEAVRGGSAVLVAPPGTGKTTLVPLALADGLQGRVVVAEPRRIAARAAARRMAVLRGEQVGGSVGYSVRGDRRVGPGTRVEVVTTGLLVQRLLADPELAGVGTVMIDECHERHLDTDLALAFLVECRQTLRPDLRLLVL